MADDTDRGNSRPPLRVRRVSLDTGRENVVVISRHSSAPLDASRRRRLAPEAIVALDWYNDMSKLVLDINDAIEAAADDRAHGVIIRRLRRALQDN